MFWVLAGGRGCSLHIPHPALSPAASLPGSHTPCVGSHPRPHQPSDGVEGTRGSLKFCSLSLNKTSMQNCISLPSRVENAF